MVRNHLVSQARVHLMVLVGAPERCVLSIRPSRVTQSIDIWFLGCVFSVSATWVVLGFQGVRQYKSLRKAAIDRIVEDYRKPQSSQSKNLLGLSRGDYFHDGRDVLQAVTAWHDVLRSSIEPTGRLTIQLLDLIDSSMLLADPASRINAASLCEELAKIARGTRKQQQLPTQKDVGPRLSSWDVLDPVRNLTKHPDHAHDEQSSNITERHADINVNQKNNSFTVESHDHSLFNTHGSSRAYQDDALLGAAGVQTSLSHLEEIDQSESSMDTEAKTYEDFEYTLPEHREAPESTLPTSLSKDNASMLHNQNLNQDSMTIVTDNQSNALPAELKHQVIKTFATDIWTSAGSVEIEEHAVDRIAEALPELLRQYSVEVMVMAQPGIQRDATIFIRHYRK